MEISISDTATKSQRFGRALARVFFPLLELKDLKAPYRPTRVFKKSSFHFVLSICIRQSATSNKHDVTVNNSRCASPRKLIKQVALESPPQAPHTVLRSVSADVKTEAHNRDGTKQTRQRLRKVGPFAIGSISTSDSTMRYAGLWAPPSKDDSDGEDMQVANNSSEKPVSIYILNEVFLLNY